MSGCAADSSHTEVPVAASADTAAGSAGAAALEIDGDMTSAGWPAELAGLEPPSGDRLIEKVAGLPNQNIVKTNCNSAADTDANVRMRFCQKTNLADCKNAWSRYLELSHPGDEFEECKTDHFGVGYADPAWTVTWVELSHDATGSYPAWDVDWVDVEVPLVVQDIPRVYWMYVYHCSFLVSGKPTRISGPPKVNPARCVQQAGHWF